MKRKLLSGLAIGATLLLGSCAHYFHYVAPPFTNVMKIAQVKPNMKFKQVVDILGVEPYDIYHVEQSGAMLASFNYRLKKRILKINTLNRDEFNRETTNENSQTAGELYYERDYKTLHVLFNKEGELASYITSAGVANSNYVVISGNTVQYINQKDITLLDPAFNSQVIDLKKHEKTEKRKKRGFFSNLFGAKYEND